MKDSLDQSEDDRIERIIEKFADEIDEANLTLVIDSAGVAQAVGALRKSLDKVEQCLDDRQYEEVAGLGYRDVSSAYIFLQRTMGAINDDAMQRSSVISDIACEARVAYERVEPLVRKWSQGRKLKFKDEANEG